MRSGHVNGLVILALALGMIGVTGGPGVHWAAAQEPPQQQQRRQQEQAPERQQPPAAASLANQWVVSSLAGRLATDRQGPAGLSVYFGDLHSHTGYSDGVGTPADAYAYARQQGGLDFLALTDHGYMVTPTPAHWLDTLKEADRFTEPGKFVALTGVEWTNSSDGHINVFTSRQEHPDRDQQPTYLSLYQYVKDRPDTFAEFNHPGFDIQRNWDAFAYYPWADGAVVTLEVASGPYPHNLKYESSYQLALARGWHVAAVGVSDVHQWAWGTATPSRTGVWATALTRPALVEAIRARRTYASEDANVRVWFSADGQPLGSVLSLPYGDPRSTTISFDAQIWDPDAQDRVRQVELVDQSGQVVCAWRAGEQDSPALQQAQGLELQATVHPTSSYAYWYLRVEQADGDRVVTSPIWAQAPGPVFAHDLESGPAPMKATQPAWVQGSLVNLGSADAQVRVELVRAGGVQGAGEELLAASPTPLSVKGQESVPFRLEWTPRLTDMGRQDLWVRVATAAASADGAAGTAAAKQEGWYPLTVQVYPATLPELWIDEGHNNRGTGQSAPLQKALLQAGWDSQVLSEGWQVEGPAAWDRAAAVWVGYPESGFSLLPTTFSQAEMEAVARYVQGGGVLILAGGAGDEDGLAELDRLGQAVGAHGRLSALPGVQSAGALAVWYRVDSAGSLEASPGPQPGTTSAEQLVAVEKGLLMAVDASVVQLPRADGSPEAAEPRTQVLAVTEHDQVYAAAEPVGRGWVIWLGSAGWLGPEQSAGQERGTDNLRFIKALSQWIERQRQRLQERPQHQPEAPPQQQAVAHSQGVDRG
ncbi:MAG: CehA/McbA family metallohydrolase [Limnochordaceae bacterium]|nr:CehA/McbA family metallohydrolase [Limnochordaceae bacterium]